jgi:transposase
MPKPYSTDLRERAVEAVESGASRREAAEIFKVGVSSVIRRNYQHTNPVRAKLASGEAKTYYYHRATGTRLEGDFGRQSVSGRCC